MQSLVFLACFFSKVIEEKPLVKEVLRFLTQPERRRQCLETIQSCRKGAIENTFI